MQKGPWNDPEEEPIPITSLQISKHYLAACSSPVASLKFWKIDRLFTKAKHDRDETEWNGSNILAGEVVLIKNDMLIFTDKIRVTFHNMETNVNNSTQHVSTFFLKHVKKHTQQSSYLSSRHKITHTSTCSLAAFQHNLLCFCYTQEGYSLGDQVTMWNLKQADLCQNSSSVVIDLGLQKAVKIVCLHLSQVLLYSAWSQF